MHKEKVVKHTKKMFPKKDVERPSESPMHERMETKKIETKERKTGREQMPKKMEKKLKEKVSKKLVKKVEKKEVKKPKLGTGKRFASLTKKLEAKGAKNPKALAAYIGRKKFGAKKMTKMAVAGKRRKS